MTKNRYAGISRMQDLERLLERYENLVAKSNRELKEAQGKDTRLSRTYERNLRNSQAHLQEVNERIAELKTNEEK